MARVRRTKRANQDFIIGIWRYIAQENPTAATNQLAEIERKFRLLAEFSQIGPKRGDIRTGLRMFRCNAYVILYRKRPRAWRSFASYMARAIRGWPFAAKHNPRPPLTSANG
jgi:plasmid stabilization system protein ParE